MSSSIFLALMITVTGMGLVFGAIFLLWGVMALIVRIAPSKEEVDQGISQADADVELLLKQRAAAAAVALAMETEKHKTEIHEFPLPPTAVVSPWQAVMRSNMLNKKRGSMR